MLNVSNLSKSHGKRALYLDASFQIYAGEKVGLVGPNGSGKTSLFRILTGEEAPDRGSVVIPKQVRMSYFSQSVGDMKGTTALEEVTQGDAEITRLTALLRGYEKKLSSPDLSEDEMTEVLTQMGETQTRFEELGGYDLESRAEEILTGLGIHPSDHRKPVEHFSGGWKMRVALAKVLVTNPDLILMDEPTNYLDLETILWLENWLKSFPGAIFMTTHDRHFMNNVVKKIIEVSNQQITTYSGNYDFYLKEKEVRLEKLRSEFKRQQDSLAKEEEFIARFKARASHAAQVQSRVKKLDKIERIELPPEEQEMRLEFPPPPRGGEEVVMMKDLGKHWIGPDGKEIPVFDNLTFTVLRLEKIAVVGVNGAGKSTLLKTVVGKTEPSSGSVALGPSIRSGYFGQHTLEVLHADSTILEEIRRGLPDASDGFLRNLLAAFLFTNDDIEKKVRQLSGGEKARLVLARLFSEKNNLLILDEPTNHLDMRSREILLDALKRFEGTILFVSHDRHFLNELATKVIEVDREKGVTVFPGDYAYYLHKTQKLVSK